MSRIKICGVTRQEDAEMVIAAGADYLGLIFAESSPRKMTLERAGAIARSSRSKIALVGVFKDQPLEFISEAIEGLSLDMVQLHGGEPPEFCQSVSVPVIKAFSVAPGFNWTVINEYSDVNALLLDRPKGYADGDWLEWALAETSEHQPGRPIIFAGGLTADNVGLVIDRLHPFAVDVASGVETEPGIKDAVKVRKFCDEVRRVKDDAVLR